MSVPHPLVAAALALSLLPCFLPAAETDQAEKKSPPPEKPNLLFILADDLGYGDLGSYGCEDVRTPHLDQLATEGAKFTDFYANAPVCSPTRIAFLTGRYQQRFGLDNALAYQEKGRGLPAGGATLATTLRELGYATGLSGKWHVGYDRERRPLQQGFNHFFGLLGGNHHYFLHMDRIGVHDLWSGDETAERKGEYTTDLLTGDAIAFLEQNRDRPFFLYLSHAAPHFPHQGPDDKDKDIRPRTKAWQHDGDRATYAAMVERMDQGIGEVLTRLDELGLAGNTLVVFTSDNGGYQFSRNSPFRGYKSSLWEGGLRVPCLARWPGKIEAGTVSKEPAITMDWTATFLAAAGGDPAVLNCDGRDLLDRADTGTEDDRAGRAFFWRNKKGPVRKNVEEGRAVRRGTWKLLEQAGEKAQLFDLESDPGETVDRREEHPDLARELSGLLDRWEESVDNSAGVSVP